MSGCHDSKLSFLCSHGGPGSRKGHDYVAASTYAPSPSRSQSLPQLGVPAGYSHSLGNRLGVQAYANLRRPHGVRMDLKALEGGGAWKPKPPPTEGIVEEIQHGEVLVRLDPTSLPPAGRNITRKRGKRLVGDNTNVLSHVDSLIWGRDMDGSDGPVGVLSQVGSATYKGSAGVNAAAERTPIYGHLPPTCMRTFGEGGPTADWSDPNAPKYERHDPRG